jgi:hypothetical protein
MGGIPVGVAAYRVIGKSDPGRSRKPGYIRKRERRNTSSLATIAPAQFMRTLEIKRQLRLPVILNQPDAKPPGIREAEARAAERAKARAARYPFAESLAPAAACALTVMSTPKRWGLSLTF